MDFSTDFHKNSTGMNPRLTELYNGLSKIAGVYLRTRFILTSTDRTCSEQLELSGPRSYHLNGNAFDAVVSPWNAGTQRELGLLAVRLGFRWGGQFAKSDVVHFDDGRRVSPGSCAPSVSSPSWGAFVASLAGNEKLRELLEGLIGRAIGSQGSGSGATEPIGNVAIFYQTGQLPQGTGAWGPGPGGSGVLQYGGQQLHSL